MITSLAVENLRVIEALALSPGEGINLITGANGAGKTTLLEGIYLAGRGRSFRHPDAGPFIRGGSEAAQVVIRFLSGPDGKVSVLGVRRERKALIARIDGKDVSRRSELALALPVLWIGSQPQILLESGPDIRRRFLDMGVFHVEHGYIEQLGAFARVLKQRNAALRQGADTDEILVWDESLLDTAQKVTYARSRFLDRLKPRVQALLALWGNPFDIDLAYRTGWARDSKLSSLLRERLPRDRERGFTSVGPQRADVAISSAGQIAVKKLSRGQQKLLVFAINLAIHDLVREMRSNAAIFLIDDLAAELDTDNRNKILTALRDRQVQSFITAIDADTCTLDPTEKMFHVEQGFLK